MLSHCEVSDYLHCNLIAYYLNYHLHLYKMWTEMHNIAETWSPKMHVKRQREDILKMSAFFVHSVKVSGVRCCFQFDCMKKKTVFKTILFYVSQNGESHTGFEWQQSKEIMTKWSFWMNYPCNARYRGRQQDCDVSC